MKISELQEKAYKAQCQIYKDYKEIPGAKEGFQIIEISLDIFEDFLKIPFRQNDVSAVAIREMVRRSHKTLQVATLSATAGIEIPTISLLRDLIEIEFLLRYFIIDPDEISKWWHADNKTVAQKYKPAMLRKKIIEKYPKLKKPLEADYFGHCEIATHPTPTALKLQGEFQDNSLFLPSKEHIFIWICILESSLHAERVARLVVYLSDFIHPKSDLKKKFNKLQKLMPNLLETKRIGGYYLYQKLNRAKKQLKK